MMLLVLLLSACGDTGSNSGSNGGTTGGDANQTEGEDTGPGPVVDGGDGIDVFAVKVHNFRTILFAQVMTVRNAVAVNQQFLRGGVLIDPHLALGSLMTQMGGKVMVVPYDGGAAQKKGLTDGEVDVFVGTTQAAQDEVEAGTLPAIPSWRGPDR